MERDRVAVLTIRAAVAGVIDYSKADILDPRWWLRHRIMFNSFSEQETTTTIETVSAFYRALVSNSGLTEESFKSLKDKIYDLVSESFDVRHPWLDQENDKRKQVQTMQDAWFEAFGVDKNDPEWQAREKAELDRFMAERETAMASSEPNQLQKVNAAIAARNRKLDELSTRLKT